jgi:hypothetical protein
LSSEKADKVLDEIFSDTGSSLFYSDDSRGIDDLTVGEAIAVEKTEAEDSNGAQDTNAVQGVPAVLHLHGIA